MQIDTALLGLPPMFWHALIDICLVYYLGNVLGHIVNQRRVRSWNLGAMDCVCGAIFDKEGKEVGDTVEKEDDDDGNGGEKNGEAAAHGGQFNG